MSQEVYDWDKEEDRNRITFRLQQNAIGHEITGISIGNGCVYIEFEGGSFLRMRAGQVEMTVGFVQSPILDTSTTIQ